MEIDLNKTLRALVRCLPEDGEPSSGGSGQDVPADAPPAEPTARRHL